MSVRVLGIDPGTLRTGWGVVEDGGGKLRLVAAGIVAPSANAPLEERLLAIHRGLAAVIAEHAPASVGVEDVFFAKHPNAALKLGHARGVALLAAAESGLAVTSYAPSLVKRSVVGRGQADKTQVARLVAVVLGMKDVPGVDATDALAVAITHAQAVRAHGVAARAKRPTGV
jgi:crossover junction endodeoxyribonuclease RuvC